MLIDKFAGLRNDVPEDRFDPGDLSEARNVDIDDSFKMSRRRGSTLYLIGDCHSLWCDDDICLFVDNGTLKKLELDGSSSGLMTGLGRVQMYYLRVDDRVYFSNGHINGVYEGGRVRSWGITVPGQFTATDAAGNLPAGRYQYAMTFVRSDGQESGSSDAQVVDVVDGGLVFDGLPVSEDPDITHKVLYMTSANGEQLYESEILDNQVTGTTIVDDCSAIPLDTQFMKPPVPGVHLALYSGHVLYAHGATVYSSGAFEYELFRTLDFVQLEERVTMIASLGDSVIIGTESTIGVISGRSHDEFQYRQIADYGVIPGTLQMAESFRMGFEGVTETEIALFTTHKGICAGLPGGAIYNLTGKRYEFQTPNTGASTLHKSNGSYHYLTII